MKKLVLAVKVLKCY